MDTRDIVDADAATVIVHYMEGDEDIFAHEGGEVDFFLHKSAEGGGTHGSGGAGGVGGEDGVESVLRGGGGGDLDGQRGTTVTLCGEPEDEGVAGFGRQLRGHQMVVVTCRGPVDRDSSRTRVMVGRVGFPYVGSGHMDGGPGVGDAIFKALIQEDALRARSEGHQEGRKEHQL